MIAEKHPSQRKVNRVPTEHEVRNLRKTILDMLQFEAGLSSQSLLAKSSRPFATRAECLLRYGRFFTVSEYTNSVYDYGAIKQCFSNARKTVSRHAVLYCEGVAASLDIPLPIHHAWITEPGNQFTDYPRKKPEAFEVTIPAFDVYFGIAFSGEFSRKLILGKPTGLKGGKKNKTDFWNTPGEYASCEILSVLDQWKMSRKPGRSPIPFVEWVASELKQEPESQSSLQEIKRAVAWAVDKQDSGFHDL